MVIIPRARAVMGVALALLCIPAAGSSVTADLILSLRYWQTDRLKTTRLANARLLVDAAPLRTFHFHLDLNRDQPEEVEVYEAFGEWELGRNRLRLGRFQTPFGIYNRSELYYVGLVYDPLIRYYPYPGPHLEDSVNGLEYLRSVGLWQVEAALFGRDSDVDAVVPRGDEGSVRIQWYSGRLILGLNAVRTRAEEETGYGGEAHFFGVDFRYSRPGLILRGEVVAGHVPGSSPEGFYLDALYHPVWLSRVTLVGRTEAVRGQPMNGGLHQRETVGLKWEVTPGIVAALNQLVEPSHLRSGLEGTTLYVWYTRRL
jgi:hypothetical protein